MFRIILKSLVFSFFVIGAMLFARGFFDTSSFSSDIGGINNFIGIFGTLYGIMAAFVVFEVWNQYNKTTQLIDEESSGLVDIVFRSAYFRDAVFLEKVKSAVSGYLGSIIKNNFKSLSDSKTNSEEEDLFLNIGKIIQSVTFNDDHDAVVFDHVLSAYEKLWVTRQDRISQSIMRLPMVLKSFFYIATFFILFVFVLMPFTNVWYGILVLLMLSFMLSLVSQLIEDLDNPFVGYWNLDTASFKEALSKINDIA